jgi:hypothetical protein
VETEVTPTFRETMHDLSDAVRMLAESVLASTAADLYAVMDAFLRVMDGQDLLNLPVFLFSAEPDVEYVDDPTTAPSRWRLTDDGEIEPLEELII